MESSFFILQNSVNTAVNLLPEPLFKTLNRLEFKKLQQNSRLK